MYHANRIHKHNGTVLLRRIKDVPFGETQNRFNDVFTLSLRVLCILFDCISLTCLVAGFWKPHCFVVAFGFLVLVGITRSTISELQEPKSHA